LSFPLVTPYRPFRILYVSAVILVTLFLMAFLWFALYASINSVRAGIMATMTQYDVENSTYPNFVLADTFMSNLWAFFLVIVVIGLLYWVWIYSSRKGVPVYG
jgi:hypothetical protein